MSVRVQTYVWQLDLPPHQKLVAIALADHCHDDGSEARPGQALLARKTGLDERTIRRTLHRLVSGGVILIQRQGGGRSPNCYRFPLPEDFATLRGGAVTPLGYPQGGQNDRRGVTVTPQGGHPVPPNHKEPSLETTETFQVDVRSQVAEARRRLGITK